MADGWTFIRSIPGHLMSKYSNEIGPDTLLDSPVMLRLFHDTDCFWKAVKAK